MSKLLKLLGNNISHIASDRSINAIFKDSDVPTSTISKIMNEQTNPSLDTIEKIAEVLNVDPYVLLVDKSKILKKSYIVPDDIMEMLDSQPEIVYETIRTMLSAISESRKIRGSKKSN